MIKECCANCKHLRTLLWWKDYPRGKQHGWCCNVFDNGKGDYTLMQLYSIDEEYDHCEMFEESEENE